MKITLQSPCSFELTDQEKELALIEPVSSNKQNVNVGIFGTDLKNLQCDMSDKVEYIFVTDLK